MEMLTTTSWKLACRVEDTIENGGICVKLEDQQVALFYFKRRNEWYATQNECPHKRQMILSRGMIGSLGDKPKIACPLDRKSTRLNSSHVKISYAVFCLKKKKRRKENTNV